MKNLNKVNIKLVLKDRVFILSLFALFLFGVFFVVYVLLNTHKGNLSVWYRYTGFGALHYYRARWYYIYNWLFMGLMVTLLHIYFAFRIRIQQQRYLALACLAMGALVLLVALLNLGHIVALPQ